MFLGPKYPHLGIRARSLKNESSLFELVLGRFGSFWVLVSTISGEATIESIKRIISVQIYQTPWWEKNLKFDKRILDGNNIKANILGKIENPWKRFGINHNLSNKGNSLFLPKS